MQNLAVLLTALSRIPSEQFGKAVFGHSSGENVCENQLPRTSPARADARPGKVTQHINTKYYRRRHVSFPTIPGPDTCA
ncbi:hypothetical protein ACN22W_38465 [Burkholderia theae]|uniref:hypothetical protein n=1 Tax=Burkholderia theae TaxID=3143496 RepID=UPI003AFA7453